MDNWNDQRFFYQHSHSQANTVPPPLILGILSWNPETPHTFLCYSLLSLMANKYSSSAVECLAWSNSVHVTNYVPTSDLSIPTFLASRYIYYRPWTAFVFVCCKKTVVESLWQVWLRWQLPLIVLTSPQVFGVCCLFWVWSSLTLSSVECSLYVNWRSLPKVCKFFLNSNWASVQHSDVGSIKSPAWIQSTMQRSPIHVWSMKILF